MSIGQILGVVGAVVTLATPLLGVGHYSETGLQLFPAPSLLFMLAGASAAILVLAARSKLLWIPVVLEVVSVVWILIAFESDYYDGNIDTLPVALPIALVGILLQTSAAAWRQLDRAVPGQHMALFRTRWDSAERHGAAACTFAVWEDGVGRKGPTLRSRALAGENVVSGLEAATRVRVLPQRIKVRLERWVGDLSPTAPKVTASDSWRPHLDLLDRTVSVFASAGAIDAGFETDTIMRLIAIFDREERLVGPLFPSYICGRLDFSPDEGNSGGP